MANGKCCDQRMVDRYAYYWGSLALVELDGYCYDDSAFNIRGIQNVQSIGVRPMTPTDKPSQGTPDELDIVRNVLIWYQTAYARFHNTEHRGVIEANEMAKGWASVELAKYLKAAQQPTASELKGITNLPSNDVPDANGHMVTWVRLKDVRRILSATASEQVSPAPAYTAACEAERLRRDNQGLRERILALEPRTAPPYSPNEVIWIKRDEVLKLLGEAEPNPFRCVHGVWVADSCYQCDPASARDK